MKKRLATTVCALGLLVSTGVVSAGTSAITYAKVLPSLSRNIYLATGTKDNNSNSKVENSIVGQNYEATMWIVDANGKKVSNTAIDVTDNDNDTRFFIVDQSAVGGDVTLVAENDQKKLVSVEISGRFYPDTR
ncbi:hypothetical protein ACIP9G_04600 [Lysinibacillus sp. NPDC093197]|uniref:hypothetical protein n=1 Tax=Lysinibacillus sp. NPDC093197 TaxID=3364132 RepID=UPI00380ECE6A